MVACFQSRGSVHYHHGGTKWHAGEHGAWEVVESSISCAGYRNWSDTLGVDWAHLRPENLPPQWCTSSNKAKPSSTKLTPNRAITLWVIFFQTTTFHTLVPKFLCGIIMKKCIQSKFKRLHSLLLFQQCLKVKSLFWDSILQLQSSCKIKIKKHITCFQHTVVQHLHYHPKM